MKRISIAVLIDALAWDIVEEHGFLPELVHRRPLRTVFGFSSAAIPSLMSGKHPDEHGRWFLYRRNPVESPFGFARLLAPIEGSGPIGRRVRTAYEKCFASFTDIRGYYHLYQVPLRLLPQFDLPEKRAIFEPDGLESAPTLFARLRERGIPHRVWYWRTPETRNFEELSAACRGGDDPFLFFYAFELDGVMHARGTRSAETRDKLRAYEDRIRRAFEEASRRADAAALHVFSDHGMVDVVRSIDVMGEVRALPFREGRDYLPFYDSTFARFWFRSGEAAEAIRSRLAGREGGSWVPAEELRRLRIHFPAGDYGEAIFAADPGTVIAPSFMGEVPPAAMHGYHPDRKGSDGVLLSTRAIPPGTESILDLASLLEKEAVRAHRGTENGDER